MNPNSIIAATYGPASCAPAGDPRIARLAKALSAGGPAGVIYLEAYTTPDQKGKISTIDMNGARPGAWAMNMLCCDGSSPERRGPSPNLSPNVILYPDTLRITGYPNSGPISDMREPTVAAWKQGDWHARSQHLREFGFSVLHMDDVCTGAEIVGGKLTGVPAGFTGQNQSDWDNSVICLLKSTSTDTPGHTANIAWRASGDVRRPAYRRLMESIRGLSLRIIREHFPRVTTGKGLLDMLNDFRADGMASFFVCDLPGVCTSEALSRTCWALALACAKGDSAMPDMLSVEAPQNPSREAMVTGALGYAENILPKIRADLARLGNLLAVTPAYPKTTLAFAHGEIVLDLSRNPATSVWRV